VYVWSKLRSLVLRCPFATHFVRRSLPARTTFKSDFEHLMLLAMIGWKEHDGYVLLFKSKIIAVVV
jgi:hypothetical protein